MVFHILRSIIILICVTSCNSYSRLAADPVLVVAEVQRDQGRSLQLDAARHFQILERLTPFQMAGFDEQPYYQVANPEGFEQRGGLVYFPASGQLQVGRFWTVAGPEVFEKFMTFLTDARGEGAIVVGDEFRKSITVKPTGGKPAPGKPIVSWADIFVRYDDGLITISSSREILTTSSISSVMKQVKQAIGKDWYLWAGNENLSASDRKLILTALETHYGVSRQRRDSESDEAFQRRREEIDGLLRLVELLLFDLEQIEAWYVAPTEAKSFRASLQLTTKKGSQFQKILKQTVLGGSFPSPATDASIGHFGVSMKVPEDFRALVASYLLQPLAEENPLRALVATMSKDGQVRCRADIGTTEVGQPAVKGTFQFMDAAPKLSAAMTMEVAGVPMQLFSLQQVYFQFCDPEMDFALTNSTTGQSSSFVLNESSDWIRGTLAYISLDLAKIRQWEDKGEAEKFVTSLERAWHMMFLRHRLPIQFAAVDTTRRGEGFHPLMYQFLDAGDWHINCEAKIDANRLSISCDMGSELYQWYVARQLLNNSALLRFFM